MSASVLPIDSGLQKSSCFDELAFAVREGMAVAGHPDGKETMP